jgi:Glycosyltransferase family 87
MQAAARVPEARIAERAGRAADRQAQQGTPAARRRARAVLALGLLGLAGIVACAFLIAAGSASKPTSFVPARSGGWPGWLAGPLQGLGVGITRGSFEALTLIMCAGYVAALAAARRLHTWALAAAIVAAHVALLLGPPLISQDVFGYIGYARLGALHGLDPYTRLTAEVPSDEVFPFLGWPFKHSPYGPLFTLASYATAPLSVAGALWAFKALALLSSLAAVALVASAARALGGSARWAAAFVGLNPVLLVLAVGGAHNDTLIMLAVAAALALSAASRPRLRAAAGALVAGVGVKVTAALALAFLVLAPRRVRERLHTAASAALALALLAVIALAGFGSHALGFLGAIGEQQQLVAVHSIPAETARLFGLHGTPGWWRQLFAAGFLVTLALCLWRTARGWDWRLAAGWSTLALLLSTAWLLPWYAIWLLPLAAVCGNRRLRAATLLFCAYAILIHLPLAEPLLSPKHPPTRSAAVPLRRPVGSTGRQRLEFARLQVSRHAAIDIRG